MRLINDMTDPDELIFTAEQAIENEHPEAMSIVEDALERLAELALWADTNTARVADVRHGELESWAAWQASSALAG